MTTNETPTQTQENTTTQPKTISDPNLSFADYQKLRRGEALAVSTAESAPEAKSSVQNKTKESDTEEKEAKDSKDETEEEESGEETESKDSDKDKPKKKGGFQRRIDKLNARVSAREQEVEYWKSQALKGAGETKTDKVETRTKPAAADGEPNAEDFDTHAEYVKAVTAWTIKQELKERDQKAEKSRLEVEQEKLRKSHTDRVNTFAEKTKDFWDALENVEDVQISPAIETLLIESEHGPALMYELAKNRGEFEKICKLSPLAAARELGKIEFKIAQASESKSESKSEPNKLTNAPKPIEPVGGSKGVNKKSIDDPDISFAEYVQRRREQMRKRA